MAREGHDPERDEDEGCHVHVEPVRVRSFDPAARCDVLRTVAFRAVGSCGWRGPSRASYQAARDDRAEHLGR